MRINLNFEPWPKPQKKTIKIPNYSHNFVSLITFLCRKFYLCSLNNKFVPLSAPNLVTFYFLFFSKQIATSACLFNISFFNVYTFCGLTFICLA